MSETSNKPPETVSQKKERLLREMKDGIQAIIDFNESGHFHFHTFNSPAKKPPRRGVSSTPDQPDNDLPEELRKKKPDSIVGDGKDDLPIPKDILERSFSNPNFFSSTHIKHVTTPVENGSTAQDQPGQNDSPADPYPVKSPVTPGKQYHHIT